MTITGLLLNCVYVYAIWNETNSYTIWHMCKSKVAFKNSCASEVIMSKVSSKNS